MKSFSLRVFVALSVCTFRLAPVWGGLSVLKVNSCVQITALTGLSPLPDGDKIWVKAVFDNDEANSVSMPKRTYINNADVDFSSSAPLCFNQKTDDITQTIHRPKFKQSVRLMINGYAMRGVVSVPMPDKTFNGGISTVTAKLYTDEALGHVSAGTLTFTVFHQFQAEYLKISQRNWHTRRGCFSLYGVCLLQPGVESPSCIDPMPNLVMELFPEDSASNRDQLEYIQSTNTIWAPNGGDNATRCWKPHSQFLLLKITTDVPFGGIRLGFKTGFSSDPTQGADLLPSPWFSFGFSDDSSNAARITDWQLWAADLSDANMWQPTGGSNPAYDINPLWFYKDTEPGKNGTHRFTELYKGYIETWNSAYISGHYQGEDDTQVWDTWLSIITDTPADNDDTENLIGQLRHVACKQVFGYNAVGTLYPSHYLDRCWNSGELWETCIGDIASGGVRYPPILAEYSIRDDYGCVDTSPTRVSLDNFWSLSECTALTYDRCKLPDSPCDYLESSFYPLYFECDIDDASLTQQTTIAPSIPPTTVLTTTTDTPTSTTETPTTTTETPTSTTLTPTSTTATPTTKTPTTTTETPTTTTETPTTTTETPTTTTKTPTSTTETPTTTTETPTSTTETPTTTTETPTTTTETPTTTTETPTSTTETPTTTTKTPTTTTETPTSTTETPTSTTLTPTTTTETPTTTTKTPTSTTETPTTTTETPTTTTETPTTTTETPTTTTETPTTTTKTPTSTTETPTTETPTTTTQTPTTTTKTPTTTTETPTSTTKTPTSTTETPTSTTVTPTTTTRTPTTTTETPTTTTETPTSTTLTPTSTTETPTTTTATPTTTTETPTTTTKTPTSTTKTPTTTTEMPTTTTPMPTTSSTETHTTTTKTPTTTTLIPTTTTVLPTTTTALPTTTSMPSSTTSTSKLPTTTTALTSATVLPTTTSLISTKLPTVTTQLPSAAKQNTTNAVLQSTALTQTTTNPKSTENESDGQKKDSATIPLWVYFAVANVLFCGLLAAVIVIYMHKKKREDGKCEPALGRHCSQMEMVRKQKQTCDSVAVEITGGHRTDDEFSEEGADVVIARASDWVTGTPKAGEYSAEEGFVGFGSIASEGHATVGDAAIGDSDESDVKDVIRKIGKMERDAKDELFGRILSSLKAGNELMEADVIAEARDGPMEGLMNTDGIEDDGSEEGEEKETELVTPGGDCSDSEESSSLDIL